MRVDRLFIYRTDIKGPLWRRAIIARGAGRGHGKGLGAQGVRAREREKGAQKRRQPLIKWASILAENA